jgi:hypothetical protein
MVYFLYNQKFAISYKLAFLENEKINLKFRPSFSIYRYVFATLLSVYFPTINRPGSTRFYIIAALYLLKK